MTYNRLGALLAGIFGLGWLLAIAINLLFWLPQTMQVGLGIWYDAGGFLSFVQRNVVSWQVFHVGVNLALLALIMLIPLLEELFNDDPRRRALSTAGVAGGLLLLLASLIDQFGSPVLALHMAGNPMFSFQIWGWMEPWRDLGLKTASYWLLGFWMLWLSGRFLLGEGMGKFGRFSQVLAVGLLLLAFVKTFVPAPLLYYLSETGAGGVIGLLFPVWGLWLARWFWRREAADQRRRPVAEGE
ncbi:MAG: hypothetical protein R6X32_15375 [Chloroflexota bacterium]